METGAVPGQQDALIGQSIGNYRVTQKLGEGGMGSVYLAEHPGIGKRVALKVLHAEYSSNDEVVSRFFNEARAVNDIQHPNIVDIIDYGVLEADRGRQLVYFFMEYLAGQTLNQVCRAEAPLPPERSLTIALQVADALAASHRCGIVHRDLKPENIILVNRGRDTDFVKLLDFGIAKLTGDQAGSKRTRTGMVIGTPAYMSPEQCEGRGSVDHRTDIYALGIVLYEMLTGRVPFIGEGYGEILVQHLTQAPVPPSSFRLLPPHLEAVVLKSLEKNPAMRFPTMDDFMRALADPVGYVEAHGGVGTFAQQQLAHDDGPAPSTRLSPAAMGALTLHTPKPGSLTPVPSGLTTSGQGYRSPTAAGVPSAGPAPTGMAEPAPRARNRAPLFAAMALVGIGAAVGAYLVLRPAGTTSNGTAAGTGTAEVAAGTGVIAAGTGSAVSPDVAGSAAGTAATGTGSAGSGTTDPVGSAGSAGSAGSGTTDPVGSAGSAGSAGSGSATVTVEPESVKLSIKSSIPGAEVRLNGVVIGTTPLTEVAVKRGDAQKLELRLNGYETYRDTLDLSKPVDRDMTIALKKRTGGTRPPNGSGSGSGGKGSGSGTKPGGTGLLTPD